jgi:hypothetical protein
VHHLPRPPLRVQTRQGQHWYYRRPQTPERCPNRAKVGGLRLDIRCDEGNVVAPPSVHPSGFLYEFLDPLLPEAIEELPPFDYGWLPGAAPAPAAPVQVAVRGHVPEERLERRAHGLALTWQVSERGQGQGTDTFKLAGYLLHSLGLDPESAYRVLAHTYNPRCPQPYGEAELRRKVQQAATVMRDRRPRLAAESDRRGERAR